jgi:hypothetical protein
MMFNFELKNPELTMLAYDVYQKNTGEFSVSSSEETLREKLIALNGGSTKINYKSFRRNKVEIFEAMEEILGILITEGITNQFDEFVELKNLAFGDTNFFMVEDYRLFPVATVSAGNGNMRRQRMDREPFQVSTKWKGVKIYDELERFLAGRVDWARMINKVARSFSAQISADIYKAIQTGYNALTAPYVYSGSADRVQLLELAEHIEAAVQREVTIYGTKIALQNFSPAYVPTAGSTIEDRNTEGFFRVIDGMKFVEIKQAHVPGTDTFAIGDKFLLVIPQGEEKIVKMVIEGEPIIDETTSRTMNSDRSVEYEYQQKYGVSVLTSGRYGAYLLP